MVLQRDRPNAIWGWTNPGESVSVTIGAQTGNGVAGEDGKWTVRIKPPATGGPYRMEIRGSQRQVLEDVMVGDVWLCAGQSNMAMGILRADHGEEDARAATDSGIRLLMVDRKASFDALPTVEGDWKVCRPDTITIGKMGGFSAVGYHFGRELRAKLKVPIGLIQLAWGGSTAEAWMSTEALSRIRDFSDQLRLIITGRAHQLSAEEIYTNLWLDRQDQGATELAHWETDLAPSKDWVAAFGPGDVDALGVVEVPTVGWYRRTLNLAEPLPVSPTKLQVGNLDAISEAWVNGISVGFSDPSGEFQIPANVLRAGANQVVLRVFAGKRRHPDPPTSAYPFLAGADGARTSLRGEWQTRLGATVPADTPLWSIDGANPMLPTTLSQGMVSPLAPLAAKGVIWYQGEANVDRGYQYRLLLPALIADWRRKFEQPALAFHIVSLPGYRPRATDPADDSMAELREAQAITAKSVPKCGLAVTIDAGEADSNHPKNKRIVGYRLAQSALGLTYGLPVATSGPMYQAKKIVGATIKLLFAHVDQGLVAREGSLKGFAIAGANRKFVWADAVIKGPTVVVSSPKVPDPVAVRYAWAANPEATLYNGAGLPAVPFRTDTWPAVSYGKR